MIISPKTLSRVAEAIYNRPNVPCSTAINKVAWDEASLGIRTRAFNDAQAAIAEFLQCEEMKKVEEALAVAESTIQAYQRIQRVPDGWVTKLIRDALTNAKQLGKE